MNIYKIIGLCIWGCLILMGCQSTEAEQEQKLLLESDTTEFEEEIYIDTTQMAKEDSIANAALLGPIVVNRDQLMKKLKPNKDNIVMIDWNTLNDITLNECFNEDIGEYYWCPEFGNIIKSLEGKIVALQGYILPLEGGYFVLSMNPMASCFFCGGSGPQSIVDLKFKGPRAFKMDAYLTFKGKLRLNSDNIEELFYVLDDADVYKTEIK